MRVYKRRGSKGQRRPRIPALFFRLRRLSLALAGDSFLELSRYDLPDATPGNHLRSHLAAQGDRCKPNGVLLDRNFLNGTFGVVDMIGSKH